MLPRPAVKYHIQPTILLFSTQEKVALPKETSERKKSENTMAGEDKNKYDNNVQRSASVAQC